MKIRIQRVVPGMALALSMACSSLAGGDLTAAAEVAVVVDYLSARFTSERILDWGERPDWSPDGARLAFTESDSRSSPAYEIDLATRKLRCLTCRFGANGRVTRIYHLPDGSFLVVAPRDLPSSSTRRDGRSTAGEHETALFWMSKTATLPPQPLDAPAWGEIAIARAPTKGGGAQIAWGTHADGRPQLVVAELVHDEGRAALVDRRVVYELDPANRKDGAATFAEAYNIRNDGSAVTFWTIETPSLNGEMYEVELETGSLRNLSRDPAHDETHLFPDEHFGLEESNRDSDPAGALRGISSLPVEAVVGVGRSLGVKVPEADALARYAPHGQLRGVGRPFDLYVVRLQGERRRRRLTLLGDVGVNSHQSIPAPDGRRIAYAVQAPATGPHAKEGGLYVGRFEADR